MRTSALQWHHFQPAANESGVWPTSGSDIRKQQQADQQQLKRSQSWLIPTNCTSSMVGEHLSRPSKAKGCGAPPGEGPEEQSAGEEPAGARGTRRGSSFLCSLVWAGSMFGWRARRKESDKASSIQQHLRAIRHAENLDRQTHFRRSQVQRLVQRFDVNGTQFMEPTWQPMQQQQPSSSPATATTMVTGSGKLSKMPSGNLVDWPRGEDAEWLHLVLSQLIGGQNVWRLVDTLRRHQRDDATGKPSGEPNPAPSEDCQPSSSSLQLVEQHLDNRRQLLDLRKLSDRKLALALLKFLAELARKAFTEIQIGSCLANNQTQPLLQDPSSLGQQSFLERNLRLQARATNRDDQQVEACLQLELVEPDDNDDDDARRLCNTIEQPAEQNKPTVIELSSGLSQRHDSQNQQQIDKETVVATGDNSESLSGQQHKRPAAYNRETMSRNFVGELTPSEKQLDDEDDERDDPIRRTLERIMGTKGASSSNQVRGQNPVKHSQKSQMNGPRIATKKDHNMTGGEHSAAAKVPLTADTGGGQAGFGANSGFDCGTGRGHTNRAISPASAGATTGASTSLIHPSQSANGYGRGTGCCRRQQANGRQEAEKQVIGQSINGDTGTKTNHRNSRESRSWRCCCSECPVRRSSSRSRCRQSSAGHISDSPGHRQQQASAGGEPTVSSCCCCSHSAGQVRGSGARAVTGTGTVTGRRRHGSRSSSGGSGAKDRPTASSSGQAASTKQANSSAIYKYPNNDNISNQIDNMKPEDDCEQPDELVEDKL